MDFIQKPLARLVDWATHPHKKRIYYFSEGSAEDKAILGNKGAHLCEMSRMRLPVPPGFIVTTETCLEYFTNHKQMSTQLVDEYTHAVHEIEKQTGRQFPRDPLDKMRNKNKQKVEEDSNFPLLLSVRSGAAVSMPGMMDTVLNLGINDEVVERIIAITGNAKFAYDTHRRFLQMFGSVVLGIDKDVYQTVLKIIRKKAGVEFDALLSVEDLQQVVAEFKMLAFVPEDPWVQLRMAMEAVFGSWFSPRAISYRDIHNIPNNLGTAITIQSMVYGNMNTQSGSGVAFTRNPSTGENKFFGEFLFNAEGEDVVSGVRTPICVDDIKMNLPHVHADLMTIQKQLEKHYRDMQDIEFTVENGKLYILQTRTGKRTARASVRIAVDMVNENMLTEREALMRIDAKQMIFFLHPMIDPDALEVKDKASEQILKPVIQALPVSKESLVGSKIDEIFFGKKVDVPATVVKRLQSAGPTVCGSGLAASTGAACGAIVFTNEAAKAAHDRGEEVILCRHETSPEDIVGMKSAVGILTMRGGMTSHAGVIARGMGKSAVTGASGSGMTIEEDPMPLPPKAEADLGVNEDRYRLRCTTGDILKTGDVITLDGATGMVYMGEMPMVPAGRDEEYQTILKWADKYKRMLVLANAETPDDVEKAFTMGAEGIGLCRTEHMFFAPDRIDLMRSMILSENSEERKKFLNEMLPFQREDFLTMFRECNGRQITIRLLDPPLHEFLPNPNADNYNQQVEDMAVRLEITEDQCRKRIRAYSETNPMLGFRGIRLSIVHPEITEMQTKAIIGAVFDCYQEGIAVHPEIMFPLVCSDHEIEIIAPVVKNAVSATVVALGKGSGFSFTYKIGTMLEVPRACVRAESIVTESDISFVSIGTNDLTQLMYGFSRDDTAKFMPDYLNSHILAADPFVTLDVRGVGSMVQLVVNKCRRANPAAKIGVCGEHGGDPASIKFFDEIGMDYISCSPYRIPIAKIAAAQAHIEAVNKRFNEREVEYLYNMGGPFFFAGGGY